MENAGSSSRRAATPGRGWCCRRRRRAARGNRRVGYFLETDDFDRDHAAYLARGVRFLEAPRRESYGVVAVFADPWGGKWDLIQPTRAVP